MKERKRERERERERIRARERGPRAQPSPQPRSTFVVLVYHFISKRRPTQVVALSRSTLPPHPDRPAVHPHPGAGLSSPAVPLSLSILLFFPLAIRIVLRAHHYHRFLVQASYSRTRRPHYQHQEAGLPPIQISTLWTLPWPRPRRASPVTRGQSSEMLQGRGQVRS